jgi:hypothetical protein
MARKIADPSNDPVLSTYDKYEDAQSAVDKLSDNRFPVQSVAIVGVNLKMVEQVIGRMSWGRAAAGGLMTGAWFGLLLGLFVSFFASSEETSGATLIGLGLLYGAGFGIIFGLVSYMLTGGKRDFVSRSQIVATRYDVHVASAGLNDAKKILGLSTVWPPPLPEQGSQPASGEAPTSPGV